VDEALQIDPHEYFGVVLDLPEELIPRQLAIELSSYGTLELWRYQAFANHVHSDYPADPELNLRLELRRAARWRQTLESRFPHRRFVIATHTLDQMTWYQATETAPADDDETYQPFRPTIVAEPISRAAFGSRDEWLRSIGEAEREAQNRSGRVGAEGPCEKCGERIGFTEPQPCSDHRGAMTMTCRNCRATLVHSTRTIRDRVEPGAEASQSAAL